MSGTQRDAMQGAEGCGSFFFVGVPFLFIPFVAYANSPTLGYAILLAVAINLMAIVAAGIAAVCTSLFLFMVDRNIPEHNRDYLERSAGNLVFGAVVAFCAYLLISGTISIVPTP